MVTGNLACKGRYLPQTNKENPFIFFVGADFVLFYMLDSIIYSECSYLCGKFLIINVIT